AERRATQGPLNERGLLPVSERPGARSAAQPALGFGDSEIVVVGTDSDPNTYRQALNALLPPFTDLNMLMGLTKMPGVKLTVRFAQIAVDADGRYQGAVDLPSTDARLTERVGSWPDPKKHARPWEKTRWTEPQPPFLLKVSIVPSFDKMLAPLHEFGNGELPAFLFPQNMPFAKEIYYVPEGVDTWSSPVGLEIFHLRILLVGILERIPGHRWTQNFVHNRPWIGRSVLAATSWLPGTTKFRSTQVPLSSEFVQNHPNLTAAILEAEKWVPAVRDGQWIQMVPLARGRVKFRWFDDAQPDPMPLHRSELNKPVLNAEQARLDGSVVVPYAGESVEIPETLAERWAAN
ncbi:hypothetical protein, partial [Streptomyces roseolus]|uniref:hypothetical protein n=1 Tax=Streptomyces roseolus TaxID=67358 RepID=UPI0036551B45